MSVRLADKPIVLSKVEPKAVEKPQPKAEKPKATRTKKK